MRQTYIKKRPNFFVAHPNIFLPVQSFFYLSKLFCRATSGSFPLTPENIKEIYFLEENKDNELEK